MAYTTGMHGMRLQLDAGVPGDVVIPVVHEALELSGVGLFFRAVTFISALLVSFFMPETQDRSLGDILRMTAKDNASITPRKPAASRKS